MEKHLIIKRLELIEKPISRADSKAEYDYFLETRDTTQFVLYSLKTSRGGII